MSTFSIPVMIMTGISFYVGLYYLFLYFRGHMRHREDLTFALTCFSMGFYDIFCVGAYNASNLSEGIFWQKTQVMMLSVTGAIFI